jgi:hypothetical protein
MLLLNPCFDLSTKGAVGRQEWFYRLCEALRFNLALKLNIFAQKS